MGKVKKILNEEHNKAKEYGIKIALADFGARVTDLNFFYRCKNKAILKWLAEEYFNIINENVQKSDLEKSQNISRNAPIWVYWKQGFENAPELVKACLASVKANCADHPVIELSDSNIEQYIQISDKIKAKLDCKIISIATYADIIRLSLLAKYGGIWMDAALFMARPFDDEIYSLPFYTNHITNVNKDRYVSKCRWSSFLLACGSENRMMDLFRNLLVTYIENFCSNVLIDYFVIDYIIASVYMSNLEYKSMIDDVPINNPMIYWLGNNLEREYIPSEWGGVLKKTNIFKLNYRVDISRQADNTYYNVCMKSLLKL